MPVHLGCVRVYLCMNIGSFRPVKYTPLASHVTNVVTYTRALWHASLSRPPEWFNMSENKELFLFQSCLACGVTLVRSLGFCTHMVSSRPMCVCVCL